MIDVTVTDEISGDARARSNVIRLAAAQAHAHMAGLDIAYRVATAESIADAGERFDAVLALEVIEHVSDPGAFCRYLGLLVTPGGAAIAATLNRTARSFALAIVGAEYLLGWLPRGTHQWNKFVTPNELARHLAANKLAITEEAGVIYNPLADKWSVSTDMDVNYMVVAEEM